MPCSATGVTENPDCTLDSARTETSPRGRTHCIPERHASRSVHAAAHRVRKGRGRAPSVPVEEEHLRTEAVLQVLEHSTLLSPEENGILSIKIRHLHLHLRREDTFYIGVYVDDIIVAEKDESKMENVKKQLSSKFDIKDLGRLSYFLGISIVQEQEGRVTWMGQPAYTQKLLTKTGMSDCKPVKTPVDPGQRLVKASEAERALDQPLYQSVVGSLMYLAMCTRPDIAYAVGMLGRFSSKPNRSHWTAVKWVLRYLKGTNDLGILYKGDSGMQGYSDADWAGDTDDRKSTSGYMFLIAGGPVSWKSKKQSTVALSTAEAEYVALSTATQECMWMQKLLSELGNPPDGPTTILEDNQSSIAMARNPQFHGRAKHINIKTSLC